MGGKILFFQGRNQLNETRPEELNFKAVEHFIYFSPPHIIICYYCYLILSIIISVFADITNKNKPIQYYNTNLKKPSKINKIETMV